MARSSSSASPQAYRSRLATSFTPRTNPIRDEYYPLHTNYKYLINTDKVEGVCDPGIANERLFVGTAPAEYVYRGFNVLAPDPEAKLTKESVRRNLYERAFTLGAARLFDDIECALISADNIEEHIRSAPEGIVNLTMLWAAFLGRDELLPTILSCGANIHSSEPIGLTALHMAAFSDAGKAAMFLLSRGASPDCAPKYFAPLHCAAFGNSLDVAEILFAHGASVHAVVQRAGCEDNLVHCAVRCDAVQCMELFIKKGVDPGYATSGGLNVLHLAADTGAQHCLAFLLKETKIPVNEVAKQKGKKCTALHLASARGSAECVKLLLSAGAKTYIKNDSGLTALHLAAGSSSLECVEVLLRCGNADPNAEDSDNRTPLHAAVNRSEHACDIIEVLSCLGAHVNKKDNYGNSPLHIAAMEGLTPCIETLIFLGADVTSKSKKGHTALNIIMKTISHDRVISIFRHNFDCGISFSHCAENKEEVQIEFDFEPLLRFPREIIYLNCLLDEGQKDILQHPLCSAFLFTKWGKIRKFYLARLIFCFLFVSLLSIYLLTAFGKTCDGKYSQKYGASNELCQKQSLLGDIPIGFIRWVLMAITVFEILRKSIGITGYSSFWQYLTTFENILEWLVLLSVFSLFNVREDYTWQSHIGGYAVLGAWTNLMLKMGQLPMFGYYVAMYKKVLKEFMKLLMASLCLLLGFTICFCLVFSNEEMFKNPLMGFITALSMMVGELNLNILITDPMFDDPPLIFKLSSHVIFIVFLMFITISLMNLFLGIAVHDIQDLKKTAGLSNLVRQTKLILHVETVAFSRWLPRCLRRFIYRTAFISSEAGKVTLTVNPLNPREKQLPTVIIKMAFELAQLNNIKRDKFIQEVPNKNKYSLKSEKRPEIADQNVGMEIKGLQEKTDQTTLNLKKIDQEMRHLNILMKEQQTLLQNLLQNSERAVSCHAPIVCPA